MPGLCCRLRSRWARAAGCGLYVMRATFLAEMGAEIHLLGAKEKLVRPLRMRAFPVGRLVRIQAGPGVTSFV